MEKEEKGFLGRYAKILVVFAVAASSMSGIFGSVIEAPPLAIGFWRLSVGLPFFAIPVLLKQRDELKKISKKNLIWSLVSGAFLFCHFYCWFSAVKLTNVASAVVIAALHPLLVLLLTIFVLKRKVGIRPIMGIILALLGAGMIAGMDYSTLAAGNFKGDILAFLTAAFMGIYFTIGEEVRKEVPGSVYVFLVFLACWVCFTGGMIATSTPVFAYRPIDYVYMVLYTLVCQIGTHAVLNLCIGHVSSLYVSTIMSGDSGIAIIMAMIFLQQIPKTYEIIGSIVVIIGLLYYNYYDSKEKATRLS